MSATKPNLFEVINEYHEQLAVLQDADLPPECVLDTIEAIQGDVEVKMRAVVAYALQIKADAETRKAHAKRMAESAKAMENRYDSLMMYAQIGLQNSGLKLPLVLPEFTLNLAKNPPSLEVLKEDQVPAQYLRRTASFTVPDNTDLGYVREMLTTMGASNIEFSVAVDKVPLLAAIKTNPEPHKGYAKLSPQSYRLSVK